MRVELADGAWAELLDPKKVTEKKRRRYIAAMSEYHHSRGTLTDPRQLGAEQQELLDTAFDLLMVCLISAWSFDQPVSVEAFEDMSTDVFDALKRACLKLSTDILPDYSPDPDPKASTDESAP